MGGLGNHFGLRVAGGWVERRNEVQDFEESSFRFAVQPSLWIGDSGRVSARLNYQSLKSDDPEKTLSPDGRDSLPSLAAYIGLDTRDILSDPTKAWGEFPYFDAAYLGGEDVFSGYNWNRFAGEGMLRADARHRRSRTKRIPSRPRNRPRHREAQNALVTELAAKARAHDRVHPPTASIGDATLIHVDSGRKIIPADPREKF